VSNSSVRAGCIQTTVGLVIGTRPTSTEALLRAGWMLFLLTVCTLGPTSLLLPKSEFAMRMINLGARA
jgi:hypothetical protein